MDLCALLSENSSWTMVAWRFSVSCLKSFRALSNWLLNLSRSVSAAANLSLRGWTVARTSCRCFSSRRRSLSCSLAHWATSPVVMCPSSRVSSTAANSGCREDGRPSLWNSSTKACPVSLKVDCTRWQASQGEREDSTVWQPTLRLSVSGPHGVLWEGLEGAWFCGKNLKELDEDQADEQCRQLSLLEFIGGEAHDTVSVSSQSNVFGFVCFLMALTGP